MKEFQAHGNDFTSEEVKKCSSLMNYYLLFQSREQVEQVVMESQRYGVQQNMSQKA